MPGPTYVETERLDLRVPGEDDIDFLHRGVNHPDVRRYIRPFRGPTTREGYQEEFWPLDTGDDAVTLLPVPREGEYAGDPVGSAQLAPVQQDRGWANFGVWLHPDAWGHGYATEASAHLLDVAFRELCLHRVSAVANAHNEASVALCERLGFTREGVKREAALLDGDHVDQVQFGLLAREWEGPETVLER